MQKPSFYITTTLPYVNADPHVGFAMEIIRADVVARYMRLKGYEVFFNTGTDEHGLKNYRKSIEEGLDTKQYVDKYAKRFQDLKESLNISWTKFTRTTDEDHKRAAQEFWKICKEKGDIYKKNYKSRYCVGCEMEKTDSEIENDRCPIHPNLKLEIVEEENYFFAFSKYQNALLELYEKHPQIVIPDFRLKEIRMFVERGLQDFSISRLRSKLPWGVPVPEDEEHVMYVWFDALVNYVSAVGWPENMDSFRKWMPMVQYCGKDNLKPQAAIWQAMLISAGLPASSHIIVNGFISSGGQKMSKSLGNVILPQTIVDEFGVDALRYFLVRELPSFEDGDFTVDRFKEAYNASLANGIGNLAQRILKMADNYGVQESIPSIAEALATPLFKEFSKNMDAFLLKDAFDIVWDEIQNMDSYIQETEPFKLIKTNESKAKAIVGELIDRLFVVGVALSVLMPDTSEKLFEAIRASKTPSVPLFRRKE